MNTNNLRLPALLLFVFFTAILNGQTSRSKKGSKTLIEKTFDYTDFNSLDLSSVVDVEFVQSDTYKVLIRCNDNYIDDIDVSKINKTLRIGLGEQKFVLKVGKSKKLKNLDLSAEIHAPALEKIKISGASKINLNHLNGSDLELKTSGASNIEGHVFLTNSLTIDASGASTINLDGTSENSDIKSSGASSIKLEGFIVDNSLEVKLSGASNAKVVANGTIKADLGGASSLKYTGDAQTDIHTSGASSVKKIN